MIRPSMISRYQLFTLLFLLLASEAPWPCCAERNFHRDTPEHEIEESEMDSQDISVVTKDPIEYDYDEFVENYSGILYSIVIVIVLMACGANCFFIYIYVMYLRDPRPAPAQPAPAQPAPAQPAPAQPVPAQPVLAQQVGGNPGQGPGYAPIPTQDNQPRPGSPRGARANPTPQDAENAPQQEVRNLLEGGSPPQHQQAVAHQVSERILGRPSTSATSAQDSPATRRRNKSRSRMTQARYGKSHKSAAGHSRSRSRPRLQGSADVADSNIGQLPQTSPPRRPRTRSHVQAFGNEPEQE